MRGLGIGISVFFGWTTNGILALFFPSLVKEIGFTGSFFMFAVIGVAALVFVWTRVPETRGVPSRRSKRTSRPARSTSGCTESALAQHQRVVRAEAVGGGRPADRIPFRANSFTRTPDAFVETVAPPQTPPIQTARARNSDSHRRGGDRTAGRRPLRRVVLTCSLVPDFVCLGPYLLT
ncbi:MFS transporter [Rhodococcus opacus]|uniref:MFS transporter n=1 Tax=Rhodococcus opacus TaxID=37919 RepID=A0AAX3Y9M3_RHOOP|nr:MFS transporter [Rhodococcus opacus]MCZ4586410.1 MFS transporter [Rhodococcus opacus]WLF44854.1 MFS transporter [Rhodococcus opacus]